MRPILAFLAAALACLALAVPASGEPDIDAYRGLGTWVSIYSTGPLARPEASVMDMKARGVRTLYLETSNDRAAVDVVRPRAIARFIDAAHAQGIKVVAWYLPSFAKLGVDFRRSMAAVNFQTPSGGRFDSFALDIEATVVRSIPRRNAGMSRLIGQIRNAVGPEYPLGAIVPEGGALYWPGFPYGRVAAVFDVFLPMAYYTYRTSGPGGVRSYISRNFAAIRRNGGAGEPIHPIGGLADKSDTNEVTSFVRTAASRGAIGASLYDYSGTGDGAWEELTGVPGFAPPTPPGSAPAPPPAPAPAPPPAQPQPQPQPIPPLPG